jgi:hypothetical protein
MKRPFLCRPSDLSRFFLPVFLEHSNGILLANLVVFEALNLAYF